MCDILRLKNGFCLCRNFFLKKKLCCIEHEAMACRSFCCMWYSCRIHRNRWKKPRPRDLLLHALRKSADSIKLLCKAEHRFRDEMRLLQPNYPQKRFSAWKHFPKFQSKFCYHQDQPTRRTLKLEQTVDLNRNCEFPPLPESGGKYLKAGEVQSRVLI